MSSFSQENILRGRMAVTLLHPASLCGQSLIYSISGRVLTMNNIIKMLFACTKLLLPPREPWGTVINNDN